MPRKRPSGPAPILAPIIALLGLALLAGGSVWAASTLDFTPAEAAATSPVNDPGATDLLIDPTPTPVPTTIVTPPPEQVALFPGTILFARAGNLYAATAAPNLDLKKITNRNNDSWPTWMPNGQRIVFVRTGQRVAYPDGRDDSKYMFYPTDIMSISVDGGQPKRLFESLFNSGGSPWFTTAVQPDVSPDGRTIALVSDGREPKPPTNASFQPVVLSTMNIRGGGLRFSDIPNNSRMGHNDPEWSPDGGRIALTINSNSGSRVGVVNVGNDRVSESRRGYANPSWSPNGKLLVAERTTETGRDIVVLDPRNWNEVPLTHDEDSFAPVWSPNGDQIAYLHRDGMKVDLRVITLDPSAAQLTVVDDKAITADGHIDPESTPAWFIPEAERTQPTAAPESSIDATESAAP
jgi:dipeptidyl aminopeptidase/acylaminoacyl peptidase